MITRISVLLTAVALTALPLRAQPAATVAPYAPKAPESASLRDTYKGIFHIGVAITPNQINGRNAPAQALILRDFDCISPENVMKMGPIHPRAGNDDSSYNFADADAYVEFGVKNNLFVIGHNLCWHSQMPGWMSQPDAGQTTLTKEVLLQRLKDHIFKVAGRYKGKIGGWDVVNEALADGQSALPMGLRNDSPFNRIIGPEYLVMAFKWAHEADPNAELYYNDYNLDASDTKRANAVLLIKYLKENGAPITGIGMQGHYNLATPTPAKIDQTIKMFAALGVKVMVTELDVQNQGGANITGAVGATPTGPTPIAFTPITAAPTIEALKAAIPDLTPEQIAAITPLLTEVATSQTNVNNLRSGVFDRIGATLNSSQKTQLTAITPATRGAGAGGAPGGARGGGRGAVTLTDAQQQALSKRYGEIFDVFVNNRDSITRVTFWGLSDPESWRAQSSPLIFGSGYVRKPAYDAVINAAKAAK